MYHKVNSLFFSYQSGIWEHEREPDKLFIDKFEVIFGWLGSVHPWLLNSLSFEGEFSCLNAVFSDPISKIGLGK